MPDDEGGNSQTEEELFENPLDGGEESEHKHPARRRAGAHGTASAVSEEELARQAQEVESEFSSNLERQKQREIQFRELKARLEDRAGDENHEVNQFLGTAKKTGHQELDDDWEVDAADYLVEEVEIETEEGAETVEQPIEFAEEDQSLMDYFHSQSGRVDTLSAQVSQFSSLISNAEEKEEERISELESELEEAEEEYENTLEEIEEEKDESVSGLKDQIANMSEGDVEETNYEETDEMWEGEWDDIVSEAREEKEEAEQEYEEKKEQIEEEIDETKKDFREQRETLRETKQEAVSERTDRLDELEEVHGSFSNDVVEYVERQTENLKSLFVTMRTLENMRGEYSEESVEAALEGSAELNQDQQGISGDISEAAGAIAYRAFQRIDYLEDAVSDYLSAADAITKELDNQDQRVGTRVDEITGLYDHLVLDSVEDEGEYGIEGLKERVMDHVTAASEEDYDALDEFREDIEAMARTP
jgi:DNA repair exonuclease SbcCD ATPase subunit